MPLRLCIIVLIVELRNIVQTDAHTNTISSECQSISAMNSTNGCNVADQVLRVQCSSGACQSYTWSLRSCAGACNAGSGPSRSSQYICADCTAAISPSSCTVALASYNATPCSSSTTTTVTSGTKASSMTTSPPASPTSTGHSTSPSSPTTTTSRRTSPNDSIASGTSSSRFVSSGSTRGTSSSFSSRPTTRNDSSQTSPTTQPVQPSNQFTTTSSRSPSGSSISPARGSSGSTVASGTSGTNSRGLTGTTPTGLSSTGRVSSTTSSPNNATTARTSPFASGNSSPYLTGSTTKADRSSSVASSMTEKTVSGISSPLANATTSASSRGTAKPPASSTLPASSISSKSTGSSANDTSSRTVSARGSAASSATSTAPDLNRSSTTTVSSKPANGTAASGSGSTSSEAAAANSNAATKATSKGPTLPPVPTIYANCSTPRINDYLVQCKGELGISCGNGICVSFEAAHVNCINDCPNGVDETCFEGQVKCVMPSGACACKEKSQVSQCSNVSNLVVYPSACPTTSTLTPTSIPRELSSPAPISQTTRPPNDLSSSSVPSMSSPPSPSDATKTTSSPRISTTASTSGTSGSVATSGQSAVSTTATKSTPSTTATTSSTPTSRSSSTASTTSPVTPARPSSYSSPSRTPTGGNTAETAPSAFRLSSSRSSRSSTGDVSAAAQFTASNTGGRSINGQSTSAGAMESITKRPDKEGSIRTPPPPPPPPASGRRSTSIPGEGGEIILYTKGRTSDGSDEGAGLEGGSGSINHGMPPSAVKEPSATDRNTERTGAPAATVKSAVSQFVTGIYKTGPTSICRGAACSQSPGIKTNTGSTIAAVCGANEFACQTGNTKCIQCALVGDGKTDCDDGEDEDDAALDECGASSLVPVVAGVTDNLGGVSGRVTRRPLRNTTTTIDTTAPCSDKQYRCPSSGQCIPCAWVCDGISDCSNSDDEANEAGRACGTTGCTSVSSAVSAQPCDPVTQYRCPSDGRCIPMQWVNDSVNDCPNGDEEQLSHPTSDPCRVDGVTCDARAVCGPTSSGGHACVCQKPYYGNGITCWLPQRSEGSGPADRSGCNVTQYLCPSDGTCIPNAYILDGHADCKEGEDENPGFFDECALGLSTCDKSHGICTNVPGGTYACACEDGYEGNGIECHPCKGACTTKLSTTAPVQQPLSGNSKPSGSWSPCEYQCRSSGTCVKRNYVLDGIIDCDDADDEDPANFDECTLGVHECDADAICSNLAHSTYTCTCRDGFEGKGIRGSCKQEYGVRMSSLHTIVSSVTPIKTTAISRGTATPMTAVVRMSPAPATLHTIVPASTLTKNTSISGGTSTPVTLLTSTWESDTKQCLTSAAKRINQLYQSKGKEGSFRPYCQCGVGEALMNGECEEDTDMAVATVRVLKLCGKAAVFQRTLNDGNTNDFKMLSTLVVHEVANRISFVGVYIPAEDICVPPDGMKEGSIIVQLNIACNTSTACDPDSFSNAFSNHRVTGKDGDVIIFDKVADIGKKREKRDGENHRVLPRMLLAEGADPTERGQTFQYSEPDWSISAMQERDTGEQYVDDEGSGDSWACVPTADLLARQDIGNGSLNVDSRCHCESGACTPVEDQKNGNNAMSFTLRLRVVHLCESKRAPFRSTLTDPGKNDFAAISNVIVHQVIRSFKEVANVHISPGSLCVPTFPMTTWNGDIRTLLLVKDCLITPQACQTEMMKDALGTPISNMISFDPEYVEEYHETRCGSSNVTCDVAAECVNGSCACGPAYKDVSDESAAGLRCQLERYMAQNQSKDDPWTCIQQAAVSAVAEMDGRDDAACDCAVNGQGKCISDPNIGTVSFRITNLCGSATDPFRISLSDPSSFDYKRLALVVVAHTAQYLRTVSTSITHHALCTPKAPMIKGSIRVNVAINCEAASDICGDSDALSKAIKREDNQSVLALDKSHPVTLTFPTACDWANKSCDMNADCINDTENGENATAEEEPHCQCNSGFVDRSPDLPNQPGIKCVAEADIIASIAGCEGTWIADSCLSQTSLALLAIGIILAVVLLLACLWYFCYRSRKRGMIDKVVPDGPDELQEAWKAKDNPENGPNSRDGSVRWAANEKLESIDGSDVNKDAQKLDIAGGSSEQAGDVMSPVQFYHEQARNAPYVEEGDPEPHGNVNSRLSSAHSLPNVEVPSPRLDNNVSVTPSNSSQFDDKASLPSTLDAIGRRPQTARTSREDHGYQKWHEQMHLRSAERETSDTRLLSPLERPYPRRHSWYQGSVYHGGQGRTIDRNQQTKLIVSKFKESLWFTRK